MKKTLFAIICIIAISSMTSLKAQTSLTGTAKAEIRSPLIINNDPTVIGVTPPTGSSNGILNFGIVNTGATAGTIALSTTNVATATGGATLSSTVGTTTAGFGISGSAAKTYAISLGASSITITGTSGAALSGSASMTVDHFVVRTTSSGTDGLTGTLNTSGTDTFVVGGTLNVGAAQAEGQYSGTFQVTAAYN